MTKRFKVISKKKFIGSNPRTKGSASNEYANNPKYHTGECFRNFFEVIAFDRYMGLGFRVAL